MKVIDHALTDVIVSSPLMVGGGMTARSGVMVGYTGMKSDYVAKIVFEETKQSTPSGGVIAVVDGRFLLQALDGSQTEVALDQKDG